MFARATFTALSGGRAWVPSREPGSSCLVAPRSRDPDAIPLLLLHGWPSSFVQMLDIVPLLVEPEAQV
ncbi:MAG TPA: epoxide hydrolase N-terminal domain-containing protein [Gammaproteobacteria bacterium]